MCVDLMCFVYSPYTCYPPSAAADTQQSEQWGWGAEGHGMVRHRLASITVVVLDVDGVLTDGGLWHGPGGELIKRFPLKSATLASWLASGIPLSVTPPSVAMWE